MPSVDHLNDDAVIVGWTSGAEVAHAPQNRLKVGAAESGVEPIIAEEITIRVLRFCNAVANQNDRRSRSKNGAADGEI